MIFPVGAAGNKLNDKPFHILVEGIDLNRIHTVEPLLIDFPNSGHLSYKGQAGI